MKGNFIKYCKSFGIVAGATITLYGGFKLIDSVIQLVPAVNEIRSEQKEIKEEQKEIKAIIVNVQEEQKIQGEKIEGITESVITYYKSRPEITKEDLIRYVTPIYDELKKKDYLTQRTTQDGTDS